MNIEVQTTRIISKIAIISITCSNERQSEGSPGCSDVVQSFVNIYSVEKHSEDQRGETQRDLASEYPMSTNLKYAQNRSLYSNSAVTLWVLQLTECLAQQIAQKSSLQKAVKRDTNMFCEDHLFWNRFTTKSASRALSSNQPTTGLVVNGRDIGVQCCCSIPHPFSA